MSKKTKTQKKTKKKGFCFRIIESIAKLFYRKRNFVGLENIPQEPAIIIGNHAQIHGPFSMQLQFRPKRLIWCIGHMMHVREVPNYAFEDFWAYKPKWTHWFYRLMSYLIAPLCAYIFSNADTIGVYTDMRGLSTFRKSIQGLKEGNHIVIFPEHHKEFNEIINDFHTKFIDLARLYHKETGKELSFVPMYNSPKLKTIVFGKPIKYDSKKDIEVQRDEICKYLMSSITDLAKTLPVHTVIPYANISKKKYPKSK